MEVSRHVGLVHYNICLPDIHELVCQRIYADEIASLTNEDFRYNHMCFLLIPEVKISRDNAFTYVIYPCRGIIHLFTPVDHAAGSFPVDSSNVCRNIIHVF